MKFTLDLYIAVILTIISLLMIYNFIKKDPVIEGMANVSGVTYEALQSLASMYKEGKLKVSDLEVTGNTTLHGLTTVKNELAIVNGGGIFGTHFNHQNKGGTYIRGTFINLDKAYNTDGKIYINGDLNVSGISNINGLTVKENANFNKVLNVHVLNVHDRLWAKNRIDTKALKVRGGKLEVTNILNKPLVWIDGAVGTHKKVFHIEDNAKGGAALEMYSNGEMVSRRYHKW